MVYPLWLISLDSPIPREAIDSLGVAWEASRGIGQHEFRAIEESRDMLIRPERDSIEGEPII